LSNIATLLCLKFQLILSYASYLIAQQKKGDDFKIGDVFESIEELVQVKKESAAVG
jgi:hypothetical protein